MDETGRGGRPDPLENEASKIFDGLARFASLSSRLLVRRGDSSHGVAHERSLQTGHATDKSRYRQVTCIERVR